MLSYSTDTMKRLFFGGPLLGVVILLACFASSVWADDTFTITGANPMVIPMATFT